MDEKLRKIALFQDCSEEFFDNLSRQARAIKLNKGEILFVHEDLAENFYFIETGWIKLFRETLDGTQAVVDILTSQYIFGETAIFQDDIYPYSAEATEPMSLIAMPLGLLKEEIEKNSAMAVSMLSSMTRYRRQQDQELEHRTLQNAPQRIGCFLLRLADQKQSSPVTIHLPYDKTLVASRLGMQPETFSRALSKLKEATGIQVKGATIQMDSLSQISNYSCAACSSEFPCKDLQSSTVS